MEDNPTDGSVLFEVYGMYLLNGGSPEKFNDLTMDEVQLMYVVHKAQEELRMKKLIEFVSKLFGGR